MPQIAALPIGPEAGPIKLEFRDVSRSFAGRDGQPAMTAVARLDFVCRAREVVSIIGPSGCGKSTVLSMAAGLSRPSGGAVLLDGVPVSGPNRAVAFMLQKDLLLPWRTLQENVEFGQQIRHVPAASRAVTARALLQRFGLAEFAGHYPHQVSGGMRQRAAMARTLAVDPLLVLLDEPFSAIDAQTKLSLQRDLAANLAEGGKTAVLITHDLEEAVSLADRILVMSARPGRIVQEIVVELPDRARPLARRMHPRFGEHIRMLMHCLRLDEEVAV